MSHRPRILKEEKINFENRILRNLTKGFFFFGKTSNTIASFSVLFAFSNGFTNYTDSFIVAFDETLPNDIPFL